MPEKSNIILIGMPAAGKSTIGILLAKTLNKNFIDTDVYIQQTQSCDLQRLVNTKGLKRFCEIESQHVCELNCLNTVIATGGSVPYSDKAMNHLRKDSTVIYLYITLNKMKQRLTNFSSRGIVIEKGMSLEELYAERSPIYDKYADIKIDSSQMNHEQTIDAIIYRLAEK